MEIESKCKGSFGPYSAASPYKLLGLAALPFLLVRLVSMEAIAYLITISSSFINSPYNLCSACLLPTIHLGNMPYIK